MAPFEGSEDNASRSPGYSSPAVDDDSDGGDDAAACGAVLRSPRSDTANSYRPLSSPLIPLTGLKVPQCTSPTTTHDLHTAAAAAVAGAGTERWEVMAYFPRGAEQPLLVRGQPAEDEQAATGAAAAEAHGQTVRCVLRSIRGLSIDTARRTQQALMRAGAIATVLVRGTAAAAAAAVATVKRPRAGSEENPLLVEE